MVQVRISRQPGVIEELRGKIVDAEIHPRFPQLFQFHHNGNVYIGSDYSIMKPVEDFEGDVINIIPINKKI